MKLIIIRGIPGTGKTTLAHSLENKLKNSEVIHLDDIYTKKSGKKDYEKINKKLESFSKKDYVIIEGLIYDKDFFIKLKKFEEKYYFRLKRKISDLLKIPSRKIRNSKEDFLKLKIELDKINIQKEYTIYNNNLEISVNEILKIIY
jgi:broad-specificity NMP kinase